MQNKITKPNANPLVQEIKIFIARLFQSPDAFTVKYYKKNKRHSRHRQELLVK
jgi:hypothetical protein